MLVARGVGQAASPTRKVRSARNGLESRGYSRLHCQDVRRDVPDRAPPSSADALPDGGATCSRHVARGLLAVCRPAAYQPCSASRPYVGHSWATALSLSQSAQPYWPTATRRLPLRPATQAPFLRDWTRLCREPLAAREIQRYALSPVAYNVGLALGYRGLIAVDRDTDDAAVIDALRSVFTAIYLRGGIPVAKFGSKGRTSFCRWNGPAPFRNCAPACKIDPRIGVIGV